MAKRGKLDEKVRALPASIRYSELAEWLEDNGWTFVREAEDNHRFWRFKGVAALSIPLEHGQHVKRRYIAQVVKITDRGA